MTGPLASNQADKARINDGILVVDKPPGITSAKAVARVKNFTGSKKVGHTGTLDPFATGVLVCCLGKATRLARFFLHGDKTYEAVMHLGIETDTQDLTGSVTAEAPVPHITTQIIEQVFAGFVGDIKQVPPAYSALKHNGVPLYKLARKGTPVQKEARLITIYSLELLEIDGPKVRFSARCSGGSYIRTLCSDIGRKIGCGAHLHELRRVENSGFTLQDAVSLDQMENLAQASRLGERLVPMADALMRMPELTANTATMKKISHGSALTWLDLGEKPRRSDDLRETWGHVKVIDDRRNLLAVVSPKSDGVGFAYDCVFHQG